MAYEVSFKHRSALEGLSNSEKAALAPVVVRSGASNATRAISEVVNNLKNEGTISSKGDIVVVEAKVVA